jgi:hypothetical protein
MRLDAHGDALAELWRENMSDSGIGNVVPERMRWLYERNPAGPALTWVGVLAGTDRVIGCASLFPRGMLVNGSVVSSGVLADFAVAKDHRIAGAALAIQRALAKGTIPSAAQFAYGYPNDKSVAIFKRLGYKIVGETSFWVKPLRSAYKIRTKVKNEAVVRGAAVAVDAGLAVADGALAMFHSGLRRSRGDKTKLDFIELERADERFDALWERARPNYRIVGEKTSAYLNWRYTEFTTRVHRFLCAIDRETGQLRGYIVVRVQKHRDMASTEDIFCEDLSGTLKALLLYASRKLRSEGLSSLVFCYLGPDAIGEQLKQVGFLSRPGVRSMIACVDPKGPPALASEVFDKNAWFMMDGELDI